ncbi:MAG: TetR/AcrR family transcriptional regulator [Janthinobacterium lividum]
MASTSATSGRLPQQNRAAVRRASILRAAERLFAEVGYDSVTMTAIATQAQASVGALYDYFPDKLAVAVALITQYTHEAEAHWANYLQPSPDRDSAALAEVFMEGILAFAHSRPAYLPLFGAPLANSRTKSDREPLRKTIADALQRLKPSLTADRAFLNAQVVVEIVRGMLGVYRQATFTEQDAIVAEFKKVMRLYLADALA